jgi:NTP pyrophosphatase (non-canonical NTP hydrolase)
MNFKDYQTAAMRTASVDSESRIANLVHASLGLTTEVGEFVGEVKRMHRYNVIFNHTVASLIREELGDILWYLALAAESINVELDTIAAENIEKLKKRFPEKYSDQAAVARADKNGLGHRES